MDLDKLAKPFLAGIVPYKPGKPIEQAQRERGAADEFIKLASNENPYPPHPKIKEAILRAVEQANRYPESGAPELCERLADKHGVSRGEIFVANGTNEILDLLVRAYVEPSENCVFSELSFAIYKLVCMQCGVKHIEVPCRNYTHDLDAMAKAVTDATKLVFVCNPNNPTATYNTSAEVEAFLGATREDVLVAMDEAYYEFVDAPDYPDSLALRRSRESLIVLRTFSKCYSLAGIRIGYAVADRRIVDILHKLRQPFNVNRLAQAAAVAALDCNKDLQPFIEETIRERETLRQGVLELGCVCPPTQTNFLFVEADDYPGDICKALEEKGVIVRGMTPFGAQQKAFRVNTGTPEENQRFLRAFRSVMTSGGR